MKKSTRNYLPFNLFLPKLYPYLVLFYYPTEHRTTMSVNTQLFFFYNWNGTKFTPTYLVIMSVLSKQWLLFSGIICIRKCYTWIRMTCRWSFLHLTKTCRRAWWFLERQNHHQTLQRPQADEIDAQIFLFVHLVGETYHLYDMKIIGTIT